MKIILVVDDQKEVRGLLKVILSLDYEVIEAATGSEALALAQKIGPDLIILDLYLHNSIVTGLEALTVLKSSPGLAHIPILLISGVVDEEAADVKKAKALGANLFLPKPYSPVKMLKIIEKLLNGG